MVINNKTLRFSSPSLLSPPSSSRFWSSGLFHDRRFRGGGFGVGGGHSLRCRNHSRQPGVLQPRPNSFSFLYSGEQKGLRCPEFACLCPSQRVKTVPRLSSGHGCGGGGHGHRRFVLPAEPLLVLNGFFWSPACAGSWYRLARGGPCCSRVPSFRASAALAASPGCGGVRSRPHGMGGAESRARGWCSKISLQNNMGFFCLQRVRSSCDCHRVLS